MKIRVIKSIYIYGKVPGPRRSYVRTIQLKRRRMIAFMFQFLKERKPCGSYRCVRFFWSCGRFQRKVTEDKTKGNLKNGENDDIYAIRRLTEKTLTKHI